VGENHGNPGALAVAILGAPQDQQAVEAILEKAGVEVIYRHIRTRPNVRGTVELTVRLPNTIRGR
jgi:hypothetical protein